MLKNEKSVWLFLSPVILILIFVYLVPVTRIFWYSIIEWQGYTPLLSFNGFNNYKEVFLNNYFLRVLSNNLIIMGVSIPLLVLSGLFFSQFIYLKIFGHRIYQYLFFLPVILPTVIAAIIWTFVLRSNGPLNTLLINLKLDFLVVDWFGNSKFALFGLILTLIWKDVGFAIILFLSKLSVIDPFLYDAAKVDGANDFQTLRYITIPQLKDIIQLYIILVVISQLNYLFSYIHIMTRGGPGFNTTVLEYFIYIYGFIYQKMGVAASTSVILFVITFLFVFLYFKFSRSQENE